VPYLCLGDVLVFVSSDVTNEILYPQKFMQSKELLFFVSLCENGVFNLFVDYVVGIVMSLLVSHCIPHLCH